MSIKFTPKLTSNTSHSDTHGIAFANTYFDENTFAWKIFDEDKQNTLWTPAGNVTSGKVGFLFNEPKLSKAYTITVPNGGNYCPKSWNYEGSNDTTTGLDGTWTILDTQILSQLLPGEIGTRTTLSYSVNNTTSYKSYRLNILTSFGQRPDTMEFEILDSLDEIPSIIVKSFEVNADSHCNEDSDTLYNINDTELKIKRSVENEGIGFLHWNYDEIFSELNTNLVKPSDIKSIKLNINPKVSFGFVDLMLYGRESDINLQTTNLDNCGLKGTQRDNGWFDMKCGIESVSNNNTYREAYFDINDLFLSKFVDAYSNYIDTGFTDFQFDFALKSNRISSGYYDSITDNTYYPICLIGSKENENGMLRSQMLVTVNENVAYGEQIIFDPIPLIGNANNDQSALDVIWPVKGLNPEEVSVDLYYQIGTYGSTIKSDSTYSNISQAYPMTFVQNYYDEYHGQDEQDKFVSENPALFIERYPSHLLGKLKTENRSVFKLKVDESVISNITDYCNGSIANKFIRFKCVINRGNKNNIVVHKKNVYKDVVNGPYVGSIPYQTDFLKDNQYHEYAYLNVAVSTTQFTIAPTMLQSQTSFDASELIGYRKASNFGIELAKPVNGQKTDDGYRQWYGSPINTTNEPQLDTDKFYRILFGYTNTGEYMGTMLDNGLLIQEDLTGIKNRLEIHKQTPIVDGVDGNKYSLTINYYPLSDNKGKAFTSEDGQSNTPATGKLVYYPTNNVSNEKTVVLSRDTASGRFFTTITLPVPDEDGQDYAGYFQIDDADGIDNVSLNEEDDTRWEQGISFTISRSDSESKIEPNIQISSPVVNQNAYSLAFDMDFINTETFSSSNYDYKAYLYYRVHNVPEVSFKLAGQMTNTQGDSGGSASTANNLKKFTKLLTGLTNGVEYDWRVVVESSLPINGGTGGDNAVNGKYSSYFDGEQVKCLDLKGIEAEILPKFISPGETWTDVPYSSNTDIKWYGQNTSNITEFNVENQLFTLQYYYNPNPENGLNFRSSTIENPENEDYWSTEILREVPYSQLAPYIFEGKKAAKKTVNMGTLDTNLIVPTGFRIRATVKPVSGQVVHSQWVMMSQGLFVQGLQNVKQPILVFPRNGDKIGNSGGQSFTWAHKGTKAQRGYELKLWYYDETGLQETIINGVNTKPIPSVDDYWTNPDQIPKSLLSSHYFDINDISAMPINTEIYWSVRTWYYDQTNTQIYSNSSTPTSFYISIDTEMPVWMLPTGLVPISTENVTAVWDFSGQEAYILMLWDDNTKEFVWDSKTETGGNPTISSLTQKTIPYTLKDMTNYKLYLSAKRSDTQIGWEDKFIVRSFTTDLTPPIKPEITLTFDDEEHAIIVQVDNMGQQVIKNELYKVDSKTNKAILLETKLISDGTVFVDYFVSGNEKVYYFVRAVSVNGTCSDIKSITTGKFKGAQLLSTTNPHINFNFHIDPISDASFSRKRKSDITFVKTNDTTYPVAHISKNREEQISISTVVLTKTDYIKIEDLELRGEHVYYRDQRGRSGHYVIISTEDSDLIIDWYTYNIELSRVDHYIGNIFELSSFNVSNLNTYRFE